MSSSTPDSGEHRPHVVIVGGGFGGLNAARALAHAPVQVTLVDRHNYHLFQPLLYQVATAALSPGDIASPIRWILRKQRNVEVLLADVQTVETANRCITLDREPSGTVAKEPAPSVVDRLTYDFLIVATGAAHAYFGHPEWSARAPGLKTLDDALEIRRQVLLAFEAAERATDEATKRRLLTFAIVGGGATGVELAGALSEIARQSLRQDFRRIRPETARVVLLEGGPDVLPSFPPRLRAQARQLLIGHGVEVHTSCLVTAIDDDGLTWRRTDGDRQVEERLAAQTVLWAAGVAASPIARALGVPLDRAGRVPVEPTLAVPGHPEIFVVGDLCAFSQDGQPLPGVAQVAMQQGTHAARNVIRAVERRPLEPFRYRDYGSMATIGRGSAVADIGPLQTAGLFAWLIWLFIHILWLIGFRNRFAVMSEWAWAYVTLQRRVRLITGGRLWPGAGK